MPSLRAKIHAGAGQTGLLLCLLAGLATGLAGCAAPGADLHLAPLYTRVTSSDRVVHKEALAGAYVSERGLFDQDLRMRALRPLIGWQDQRYTAGIDGSRTDFLPPLGYRERDGDHVTSILFPLYYWRSRAGKSQGAERETDLVALPGWIWARRNSGRNQFAWFPFYGDLDDFLTWDNVSFFLFPLYARTQQGNSTGHHALFPVFAWNSGDRDDGLTWRVFPLVGQSKKPGRYSRTFFLWPLGHWHKNQLEKPPERQELKWMFWPFLGHTRVGTYRSWTTLWPFFGYAYDRASGFWAWDGPWFLVRVQGGGRSPLAQERRRFWPIWSYFRGDGLETETYAWPVVHSRKEDVPAFERASFYVLPFWHAWDLVRKETGHEESHRKLWPFYQEHSVHNRSRSSLLALNPFVRLPVFEFHYAWLWELYAREQDGDRTRERSLAGLWRTEADGNEQRVYLSGLWSRRSYGPAEGRVRETSLLFGLVRWRSGPEESDPGLLRPAFPGPGWPRLWHADPLAPTEERARGGAP